MNGCRILSNLEIVMQTLVNGRLEITSAQTNATVANRSAGQAAAPKLIQRFLALLMTSLSAMNV
jgi:hypothetical protein